MKILISSYYYLPYTSGVTIYIKNLAEWLVKKGHQVTIFCSQHDKTLPEKEIINGVEVIREKILCSFGKGVIMPKFFLKVAVRAKKFDIVNLHFPNADLGISSLFIPKEKLVITYHCDLFLGKSFINQLIQKISFLFMYLWVKRCKWIIGNSLEYFKHSYFHRFRKKFREIYPPINFEDFEGIQEDFWFIKKKDYFYLGFLWRIVYEKGINFLLESLQDPRLKEKKIHLLLWGDFSSVRWGSVLGELEGLIQKNKERITILGKIPSCQLTSFYNTLDLLVLPSIDPLESFWMVQVESLYNNTPVVASDMPWVNEVIKKTKFWYLATKKDSQSIANQILKIMDEKEKYQVLKRWNVLRKKIKKIFSYEKVIEFYEKCFTD